MVNVQTAKRMLTIQKWAAQINECQQSGKPIKQWCEENGVQLKTFYNRRLKVREAMLEALESSAGTPMLTPGNAVSMPVQGVEQTASSYKQDTGKPVFAAFPMPKIRNAAVTVRMGDFAVEIQNDADEIMVEQVLRVVAHL